MPLKLSLKETIEQDLEAFFLFQLDKEAQQMAAFTPKDPEDRPAYLEKWKRLLKDKTVRMQTVFLDEAVIGSIVKFEIDGQAEITYWLDRKYWGKGFCSTALREFLEIEAKRPILGRVAFDNVGSQKVLERCGFIMTDESTWFSNARNAEISEFIYALRSP